MDAIQTRILSKFATARAQSIKSTKLVNYLKLSTKNANKKKESIKYDNSDSSSNDLNLNIPEIIRHQTKYSSIYSQNEDSFDDISFYSNADLINIKNEFYSKKEIHFNDILRILKIPTRRKAKELKVISDYLSNMSKLMIILQQSKELLVNISSLSNYNFVEKNSILFKSGKYLI